MTVLSSTSQSSLMTHNPRASCAAVTPIQTPRAPFSISMNETIKATAQHNLVYIWHRPKSAGGSRRVAAHTHTIFTQESGVHIQFGTKHHHSFAKPSLTLVFEPKLNPSNLCLLRLDETRRGTRQSSDIWWPDLNVLGFSYSSCHYYYFAVLGTLFSVRLWVVGS